MAETETDRKKRLAEALRANLRRRKAQGKELSEEAGPDRPARKKQISD
ncbi:MAG: hypothetical protein AB7U35_08420 [Sphingobium sp.]